MYTFSGTGTRLYGHRAEAPDGSYLATKWLVLFMLPLLPLGSYRVAVAGQSADLFSATTRYQLVPVPLQWRQVLLTYAASLGSGPVLLVLLARLLLGQLRYWLE